MQDPAHNMLLPDFFLLTGFLGSGKTTLMLQLLSDPQYSNSGIIINDVGQLNIDGALVASQNENLQIVRLTNGCVCCSLMGDLPSTISELFDDNERRGMPPFDRVILETSGLSRPAPVIRSLLGLPVAFRVSILTTYDASRGALDSDHFHEASAQVAAASCVVFTKLDLASPAALGDAVRHVEAINPLANVLVERDPIQRALLAFTTPYGKAVPDEVLRVIAGRTGPARLSRNGAHGRVAILLAGFREDPSAEALIEWLENLAGFCGDRMLRTKGLIRIDGSNDRLLVQSVGTVFDRPRRLPGSHLTLDSALIVIVHSLDLTDIEAVPGALAVEWSELQGSVNRRWLTQYAREAI